MYPRSGPEAKRPDDGGRGIPTFAELQDARPPTASSRISSDDFVGSDDGARGFAVIIPNIFANPRVEKNIAEIMASYTTRFAIPECFLEGASGDPDFYI